MDKPTFTDGGLGCIMPSNAAVEKTWPTDNKDGILPGNLRNAGSPKTRSQHIADKQSLFVTNGIGNTVQSPVGIRNPHIFGLPSIDTTP